MVRQGGLKQLLQKDQIQPLTEFPSGLGEPPCIRKAVCAMQGETGGLFAGNRGYNGVMSGRGGVIELLHQQHFSKSAALVIGMHIDGVFHRPGEGFSLSER